MSGDITRCLEQLRNGDQGALDELLPRLYDELRALAQRLLAGEHAQRTLSPTALVNEAYLRLSNERRLGVADRADFFAVAAVAMRRILVDSARRRQAGKRGGGDARIDLDAIDAGLVSDAEIPELLAVDAALDRLGSESARARRVVELRVFVGLGVEEIAEVLGLNEKTVRRDWLLARAWLRRELS